MARWTLPYRILRMAVVPAIVLVFVLAAAIQFQQRLLRHRAEELFADIHNVRLYESSWSDAQALMQRWGSWGRYEGNCSARDCLYGIQLGDASFRLQYLIGSDSKVRGFFDSNAGQRCLRLGMTAYRLFGGRYAAIRVEFVVQDGYIWRTSTAAVLEVPPTSSSSDGIDRYDYLLLIKTRSAQSLNRRFPGNQWVLGTDEQLALHPCYKAGRPGGCSICYEAVVTYSTRTPQPEIVRLTTLDLSCLTRFRSCRTIEDLLPAARDWHLYDRKISTSAQTDQQKPEACGIPVWARARDASSILVVEAISDSKEQKPGYAYLRGQVSVVDSLKGPSPWPPGETLTAFSYAGDTFNPPVRMPEPLKADRRYVVFPEADDSDAKPELYMTQCGVVEDSPDLRQQVERGLAENDALRRDELSSGAFPWD